MEKITADTMVTPGELALVLGMTARNVRVLAEDGILEKKNGKYNLCESVQAYCKTKLSRLPCESDAEIDRAKRTADAQYKAAKATIAELEAKELEGKMHRSEDVEAITSDMVFTIRSILMALPGRLAVDVAEVNTATECSEIIKKGIYEAMRELARHQYDPARYEERVRERQEWDGGQDEEDA